MPYQNYNNFDRSYFHGNTVSNPNEAGYSNYRHELLPFDFYASKIREEMITNGIDPKEGKVLIVGCAFGYTVEHLIDDWGIDAYGMDASPWIISRVSSENVYSERITLGDATERKDIRNAIPGDKPLVIVSERLLSCLTDTEAVKATENMRKEAKGALFHRVHDRDGSGLDPSLYNSKTIPEWRSLVDPDDNDYWFTEEEFNKQWEH